MLVRFGRRSGQAREMLEIRNSEEDGISYPPLLPSKVDLQQVTIIPHNEWERIQDSLDGLTREAAALRAARKAKKDMHLQSQNVVKHWTNTYAGMREQKLKAKKKRDEEIEAERQILDLEEEIYKQGERKKAIEKAKQTQLYQTERMKKFHSGLLLSRVMNERAAQIEFQKNNIKSDKKWEEQLKLSVEKAFKEEQEKVEKQRRERIALAKDHLKQMKEREEEEEERKKDEEKDAEEMKRQNSLYEIEMKKKVEKRREEIEESRRLFLMKKKEEEERQQKIESKEYLQAIRKADEIYREQEKEKKIKIRKALRDLQDDHIQRMAKSKFNAKQAKEEELDYYRSTDALMAEKEKEFQDYAREVIKFESESGNKFIYPLVKALQQGPGGGHGPALVERGEVRPSYQANDSTGVQLPSYNSQGTKYDFQKCKGRLGFTYH